MQVLMGPSYNMDVSVSESASSSSPACVRDRSSSGVSASSASVPAAVQDSNKCSFSNGDDIVGDPMRRNYGSDELSDSSSSIGAPGDSEEEDDESDVVSSWEKKDGGLTRNKFSMNSLEESLLTKSRRGLSNHYSGKSKSFGNLSEAVERSSSGGEAKQVLEKEENPFNKRRRILIANKLSRKLFYSTRRNPKSMPLLPVLHDDDDDDNEEEEEDNYKHQQRHGDDDEHQLQYRYGAGGRLKLMINNSMRYKSHSCFCLADLHEEDEEHQDQQQQED